MYKTKFFHTVTNLIASGIMILFSVPKLLGIEKYIENFEQFKFFLHLEPTVFRISAGVIELFIGILLASYTIKNSNLIGNTAYFLLLMTMVSGIVLEFFTRQKPEIILIMVAIILSGLSIFKLKIIQANSEHTQF